MEKSMRGERDVLERKVLELIRNYITVHGYPPTNRELAGEAGCALSTVNVCLKRMREAGILETDHPGASRAIRVPGKRKEREEQDGSGKKRTDF